MQHYANMLWLDSTYPVDATGPGAERGTCPTSSGVPAEVERQVPNANVVFSNIKFGPIGSTTNGSSGGGSPTATSPGSTPTNGGGGNCASRWGQCGGNGWTGATCCASGSSCSYINDWYSQCL